MSSEVMPVFRVLRFVRDARSTRNAERELLAALVMRCNPAKKYMAWPSYRQLALDTQLDEATLKRAAKRLEEKGLIKRIVRANRSNVFYVNVSLLQQQAAEVKAAEEEAKEAAFDPDVSPFEDPSIPEDYADMEYDDDSEHEGSWISGGAR